MHTIIETPYFSKLWPRYWYEEERAEFAAFLARNPKAGDVITGTGGLRKIRWSRAGSGKSSGVRVIYFNLFASGEIVLIVMYAKSERGNLSAKQLLEIRNVIEE